MKGRSLAAVFGVGARRAEVTAPPTLEVRDTFATCVIFTCLLALLKARDFSRRLLPVDLPGFRVTFGFKSDFHPFHTICQDGACLRPVYMCVFEILHECKNKYVYQPSVP